MKGVEEGVYLEVDDARGTFLDGLMEFGECFVFIA